MSEHTKGPWFTFEHTDHSGMEVGPRWDSDSEYLKDCVRAVCTIRAAKHTYPCEMSAEQQANAHLIAAAPELLDLLQVLLLDPERIAGFRHTDGTWMDRARAAIAKAEGRA